MVVTRNSGKPQGEFSLLDTLLTGNTSRAKLLLAQQPSLASTTGPSGFGCLHAAALTDSHRMVKPLVAAAGSSPDAQIAALDGAAAFALRQFLKEHSKLPSSKLCAVFRGVTPLHIAAWLGHQSTVQALLEAGADSELACLEGRTALAIACYFLDCRPKRSMSIIESLLEAGADPLCADFHGIGSLVLSPHCPSHIQHLLLDRVLMRYGGMPEAVPPAGADVAGAEVAGEGAKLEAAGPSGRGSGGDGGSAGVQQDAAGQAGASGSSSLSQAAKGEEGGDEDDVEMLQEVPPPPVLHLPPDKHVDVLQASLVAKHWRAFDYFLAATSAEVEYPPHSINRILSLAITSGDVSLVLRILHSGLRPDAAGLNSQGQPHVAVAAVHGHEAVLDVLCSHGGGVTLKALHHATDARSLSGLRLLLARGRPPVLTNDVLVHIGGAHSRTGELCVMLRLLRDTAFRLRYCYRIDMPRHASESLAMVEALAEAGYRPTCYPQAIVHNGWVDVQGRLVKNYDPTRDKPAAFDLLGVNRYTWLAAKKEPWTTARHPRWPPKFKLAVQQLLLIYHAGREGGGAGHAVLPAVPAVPATALLRASGGGGERQLDDACSSNGPVTRAAKRARLQPATPKAASEMRSGYLALKQSRARGRKSHAGTAAGTGMSAEHAAAASLEQLAQEEAQQAAGSGGGGGVQGEGVFRRPALAALPRELLMKIIEEAAYPISQWVN